KAAVEALGVTKGHEWPPGPLAESRNTGSDLGDRMRLDHSGSVMRGAISSVRLGEIDLVPHAVHLRLQILGALQVSGSDQGLPCGHGYAQMTQALDLRWIIGEQPHGSYVQIAEHERCQVVRPLVGLVTQQQVRIN